MRRSFISICFFVAVFLGLNTKSIAQQFDEAEILALEISNELLAPMDLVERINADLAAIRQAYPEMSAIHVRPSWLPGELLVSLTDQAAEDLRNGEYYGLDSLNGEYGPVEINTGRSYLHLRFQFLYHPVRLAQIYSTAQGVSRAEPNYLIGDGSDIFSLEPSHYTFKQGAGDCPAGCTSNYYWTFFVSGDSVVLVYEGDIAPTSVQEMQKTPGDYVLHQNYPNPFNPETSIQYDLPKQTHTQISIFNMLGQKVKTLVDEEKPAGSFIVTWDGRGDGGEIVASGPYIYRLATTEVTESRRLLLLK